MKVDMTLAQALEKASPRLRSKMQYSVDLMRKAESLALRYDSANGFYLAFSGGKDSQALIHMAQLAGVKFDAHFSPTSVDPPELIRFIRQYYPECKFGKLEKSIYTEFIKRKCLPSMKMRWCCAEFKEKGGEGRVTLVGVRNSESVKRSKRKEVEVTSRKFSGNLDEFGEWSGKRIAKMQRRVDKDTQFDQFSEHKEQIVTCVGGKDKIVVSPIIHWDETDVWEFLNKVVSVPHCSLYDGGWTRIGCICCPMASIKSTIRDIKRWPYVKEKWIKAIMEIRRQGVVDIQCAENQGITPPKYCKQDIYQLSKYGIKIPLSRLSCGTSGQTCVGGWGVQTPAYQQDTPHNELGGAVSLAKTSAPTHRNLGGFSDSANGDCSAVGAEYNEQIERAVAEAIFDWWISKKSYKEWYAEKYLQSSFDFINDENEQV